MIEFKRHILDNGLEVILHHDPSSTMAAVNILYKVGSRNEVETQTGIAHLFEHLMFSGSKHAPDFDTPLQEAGGENNAFTNCDITNYYNLVPAPNIDTALWLESDRMANLSLTQESVDTQKKVVIEEFQETCLNKPYGDSWHHLSALAYKDYPYKWPTIGYTVDHISSVDMETAYAFYTSYYQPKNAVLCIASPYTYAEMLQKVEYYFGDIAGVDVHTDLPTSVESKPANESKTVVGRVPSKHIFLAFQMPHRNHKDYYIYDLLSDVLGYGPSSRLYNRLVKGKNLFTSLTAYVTGTTGPGLFIVEGRLADEVSVEAAQEGIWIELKEMANTLLAERELQKVKNKAISSMKFGDVNILNKAMNLAYYAALGDADIMNQEETRYESVTVEQIHQVAQALFVRDHYSELIYLPE